MNPTTTISTIVQCNDLVKKTETITEYLSRIVPHGHKCHGCPNSDKHFIVKHPNDVFCHLMEEIMVGGIKECAINDDRWFCDVFHKSE